MSIQSYRDLAVWQLAMDFVEAVYSASSRFPENERFALTVQLRRSVVSIPSNIAEGRSKSSSRDFLKFLSIAYGSLAEAQTQLEIARRLGHIDPDSETRLQETSNEIGRMLNGLTASIKRRVNNP